MGRRVLVVLTTIVLSFGILFISITQTAQVKYSFNGHSKTDQAKVLGEKELIEYYFPYPGRILPDHPLWSVKAIRDKVWVLVTPKSERKAELNLLFANKRLVSSNILFDEDKPELALSVLTKAEKYLEEALNQEEVARAKGVDTKSFLHELAIASLKHREIIEEIMSIAPDDAKPMIAEVREHSKKIFQSVLTSLGEVDVKAPDNPFDGN